MNAAPRFIPVDDTPSPAAAAPAQDSQAAKMILLALQALSQRAVIALSSLFTLIAVASAWALWYSVLAQPNAEQLIGCGMYAGFILAVEIVRRRR